MTPLQVMKELKFLVPSRLGPNNSKISKRPKKLKMAGGQKVPLEVRNPLKALFSGEEVKNSYKGNVESEVLPHQVTQDKGLMTLSLKRRLTWVRLRMTRMRMTLLRKSSPMEMHIGSLVQIT